MISGSTIPVMSGEIIVDTYEPNAIKLALGDYCQVAPLETGDYLWPDIDGKTYAIERKEASDFCKSLTSGRLAEQLSRLVETYDVPILLTEGNFNANPDGLVTVQGNGHVLNKNIPFMTIQSSLLELQTAGVFHLHTNNLTTTARLIKGLYGWSQKAEHSLLNSRSRVNTITGRADDPLWLVMGLPGIGVQLARNLMEMFGSPISIFEAFKDPVFRPFLKQIRGISDAKIDQVREVLLPNVNNSGSIE